uniref:Uncharacterized protein n=1 Tax=Chelonoidis abingdonii TaxID=106734 RepID=A0A8C0IVY5_CHEAB
QCLKWLSLRIVKELGKDVLHVDGGKLFCTICSKVFDRVKKDHILNHIKGPCHIAAMEKRKQRVENSDETAVKQQLTTTGWLTQQNENKKYWVEAFCDANIALEKTDKITPREIDLPCVFELNKQQLVSEDCPAAAKPVETVELERVNYSAVAQAVIKTPI